MDGIVRIDFENIEVATDFQAEYEGSIPFTRSNLFNRLVHVAPTR